jgi:hypothetical protein
LIEFIEILCALTQHPENEKNYEEMNSMLFSWMFQFFVTHMISYNIQNIHGLLTAYKCGQNVD